VNISGLKTKASIKIIKNEENYYKNKDKEKDKDLENNIEKDMKIIRNKDEKELKENIANKSADNILKEFDTYIKYHSRTPKKISTASNSENNYVPKTIK